METVKEFYNIFRVWNLWLVQVTTSGENTFLSYPRISLSSLFSLSTFPRHKFHLFEIFTISSEYLKEPPCPWPTSYPKMFVGSSWVDCVFKEKDKSPIKLYNKFGPQDLKKDVSSSCHKHGTKKNSESLWGIKSQTFRFVLWCSTTEPQRLFGEQGLLRSSNDMHPAYC